MITERLIPICLTKTFWYPDQYTITNLDDTIQRDIEDWLRWSEVGREEDDVLDITSMSINAREVDIAGYEYPETRYDVAVAVKLTGRRPRKVDIYE